jgi:type IV secretory pathway VirB2 component (pilin)
MSDVKKIAETATPIVEVVTSGAEKLVKGAPVMVETGGEAVEVMVEIIKAPIGKRLIVVGAVALGLGLTAGVTAFWVSRRKNKIEVEVEEIVEAVAEGVEKAHTK